MGLAATLYRDERVADRQTVNLDATLRKPDQRPVDILIEDLSATGFRMGTAEPLVTGAIVSVGISGIGRREARIVRQSGDQYGCEFLIPIAAEEIGRTGSVETIVRGDFGSLQGPAAVPTLDAFERRIRRFRGAIIALGAIGPWLLIGTAARALLH